VLNGASRRKGRNKLPAKILLSLSVSGINGVFLLFIFVGLLPWLLLLLAAEIVGFIVAYQINTPVPL
jgi:hypothetical protein